MRRIFLSFAAVLFAGSAFAADLKAGAPVYKAPTYTETPCTLTNCYGFYLGGSLLADGGNALLNNGINSSIFEGGGAAGFNGGYQFWNGNWFFAIQNNLMYESHPSSNTVNFASGGFLDMVHVFVGGNLGTLLGVSPPSASQGPVSIAQQLLANVTSTYIDPACMAIRKSTVQYCGGAGAQVSMGGRWTANLTYDYGPAVGGLTALQIVTLDVDYHF